MKKIIAFIIAAALLCPAIAAAADGLPTSECVSGLTARYTAGEDVIGNIAIQADVEGVADNEYFNVSIYTSVDDISSAPNGSVDPITFRLFKAADCVSGGKLNIDMAGSLEKLIGKCVVCVQIINRCSNNDWVRAYIEAPLTVEPGYDGGETQTVWAPAGVNAAEWLSENAGALFEREDMKITGWNGAGGALGETTVSLEGMTVFPTWEPINGYLLGDMDFDGVHTVMDSLTVLRIAVKLTEPSELDKRIGDVDFSDDITVADSLAILRISAKLAEPFDIYV